MSTNPDNLVHQSRCKRCGQLFDEEPAYTEHLKTHESETVVAPQASSLEEDLMKKIFGQ